MTTSANAPIMVYAVILGTKSNRDRVREVHAVCATMRAALKLASTYTQEHGSGSVCIEAYAVTEKTLLSGFDQNVDALI